VAAAAVAAALADLVVAADSVVVVRDEAGKEGNWNRNR
jgi:hypothetical protein